MYRVTKANTVLPEYFYYVSVDGNSFYIWEREVRRASLFRTKQEAIETLWFFGFCQWDANIEEV